LARVRLRAFRPLQLIFVDCFSTGLGVVRVDDHRAGAFGSRPFFMAHAGSPSQTYPNRSWVRKQKEYDSNYDAYSQSTGNDHCHVAHRHDELRKLQQVIHLLVFFTPSRFSIFALSSPGTTFSYIDVLRLRLAS